IETPRQYLLLKKLSISIKARTWSTILNRYEKSGQPCLDPDFGGIAFSFSPFNLMLAVGLLYVALIMFSLKSILFDNWIATPACFFSTFDRKDFSQIFTPRQIELIDIKGY
ncbi:hypothetical protein STEG23_029003, partial [Scotinomys teguina]